LTALSKSTNNTAAADHLWIFWPQLLHGRQTSLGDAYFDA
jgi:hypothetical protein